MKTEATEARPGEDSGLIYMQITDLQEVVRAHRADCDPPPGIQVRPADLSLDMSAMANLYNAVFFRELPEEVTARDVANLYWHTGRASFGILLAEDGQELVGLALGRVDIPAPGGEDGRGAVEVVAVQERYRRQGIGRMLVYRVLTWLHSQGVTTVGATAENPLAVEMLRRYGFRPPEAGG